MSAAQSELAMGPMDFRLHLASLEAAYCALESRCCALETENFRLQRLLADRVVPDSIGSVLRANNLKKTWMRKLFSGTFQDSKFDILKSQQEMSKC